MLLWEPKSIIRPGTADGQCPRRLPRLFPCTESLLPPLITLPLGCEFNTLPCAGHPCVLCTPPVGDGGGLHRFLGSVTLGRRVCPYPPVTLPRKQKADLMVIKVKEGREAGKALNPPLLVGS